MDQLRRTNGLGLKEVLAGSLMQPHRRRAIRFVVILGFAVSTVGAIAGVVRGKSLWVLAAPLAIVGLKLLNDTIDEICSNSGFRHVAMDEKLLDASLVPRYLHEGVNRYVGLFGVGGAAWWVASDLLYIFVNIAFAVAMFTV